MYNYKKQEHIQEIAGKLEIKYAKLRMKAIDNSEWDEYERYVKMFNAARATWRSAQARMWYCNNFVKESDRAIELAGGKEKWITRHNRRHHL